MGSFSKGADGETDEKRRCGHGKEWQRDRREKEMGGKKRGSGWRGGENGSNTLTPTQPQWVRRITRCLLER